MASPVTDLELLLGLTLVTIGGISTIKGIAGIYKDAIIGGIEEDNRRETFENNEDEVAKEDFVDAQEGDLEKKNNETQSSPLVNNEPILASAPPPPPGGFKRSGIPEAYPVFERPAEDLKGAVPAVANEVPIQAVVHDETPSKASSTNASSVDKPPNFFNEKINIKGVNLDDFTKVKFEDDDQRSFIHAFYYLLNRGKMAPDKQSLDDFITKYLVKQLTKDIEPDNPLKVRFVMYQSGMYDEQKDPNKIFKPYKKVFGAIKSVATNKNLDLFEVLNIISACDNLKLNFKNLDALKSNIKEVFEKTPSFARMDENEQTIIYNKAFPKLSLADKDDFKLLLKVASKKPQELLSDLERCLMLVSHAMNYQPAYQALNTKYDEFIKSLITAPDERAKFSRRNGVGDFLAAVLSDNGVKCITFFNSFGTPHTYRCDKKDVYSGGVIIYKYPNGHCVLLIPKKDNNLNLNASGVTTNSPQTQTQTPGKVDCGKYDTLFEEKELSKGGTRKRCRRRRRSRKRITRKSRPRRSKRGRHRTKRK